MTLNKLAAATALIAAMGLPIAGLAQTQPAGWTTKDGRWENWKQGTFPNSTAHFEALKAAAKGGVKHTVTDIPDWSGLWTSADSIPGASLGWGAPGVVLGWGLPTWRYDETNGLRAVTRSYGDPPPTPNSPQPEVPVFTTKGKERMIQILKDYEKGREWTSVHACLPAGFPRWHTEPFFKEFIVTPNQTWMVNELENEIRRIYTDGRGHLPEDEAYPLWEGDSIGFWDGDTLIIHTIHLRAGNWTTTQPEHSEQIETVEMARKNAQGMIEIRMTVYDPVMFSKPWHLIFGSHLADLSKTPNARIFQWACNEENHIVKADDGTMKMLLPGDPGYAPAAPH